MGICYSIRVAIGYTVSAQQLIETFGVKTPEVSHIEPRYDRNTGVRQEDVKVISRRASAVLMFDGQELDFPEMLASAIAEAIGDCHMWRHSPGYGESEDEEYVFGPATEYISAHDLDSGNVDVSGSFLVNDVAQAYIENKFFNIKNALRKYGLNTGTHEIRPVIVIS